MTRLGRRIADLIDALGPLPVSDYMAHCLFDPRDGYYTTREPFGAAGDFVTAPEISQMFGELAAVWLYAAWTALGRPAGPLLAEIGPGRGTLMKDMLRTLARLDADFDAGAAVAMVETSPRLREIQKETLGEAASRVTWHDSVAALPEQPLLIVGNEIFDAVPVRQFVKTPAGWRERCVGLDDGGALTFVAGVATLDASALPPGADLAADGTVFEVAPARTAMMAEAAGRIAASGGGGLFFDYGHAEPGLGDTFQAVRAHRPENVFERPGEADLTSHVDFAALAAAARAEGLDARIVTQGDFLLGMGLAERAGALGARADAATRQKLSGEVERLAGPQAMGTLFKALAVLPRGVIVPPFSSST